MDIVTRLDLTVTQTESVPVGRYKAVESPLFTEKLDQKFIASAARLSFYGDKLLTLVTCHGDTDTQRLVVILRQMRADENREELEKMWR